jgi:mRNA interferase HicA
LRGSEFLRKVRALARRRGWAYEWRADQGKGSHGTLFLNGRLTVVRDSKDELKSGTLHAMLRQLGISVRDLND